MESVQKRSPLALIWLTVFIDLVGFGIVIPILPLYADRYGASPLQIGILLSSYSAMQFVFAPILGSLSDRVGRKPVLAVSLFGTALASIALGFASSLPHALWLIFAARIVDGITGANIATAQAYVADVTTEEKRARGMGLIGMAFGLGFVLGPAIGGFLAAIDISLPFYVVGAMAIGNATAMLFHLPEPERHLSFRVEAQNRYSRIAAAWRDDKTRLLLLIFLITSTAFSAMEATLALLLKSRYQFDPASTAFTFVFIGIVLAAVQGGLVGRLTGKFGERPLVVLGLVLLVAGLTLLGLPLTASLGVMLPAVALLAAGSGLLTPAITALVSRRSTAAAQGASLGVAQSMASLGRIAGPLAGGLLYEFGWSMPYLAGAAVMACGLAIALYFNALVSRPEPVSS